MHFKSYFTQRHGFRRLAGLYLFAVLLFTSSSAQAQNSGGRLSMGYVEVGLLLWMLLFFGYVARRIFKRVRQNKLIIHYEARREFTPERPKATKAISPGMEFEVLALLDKFESDKRYLEKNMTIIKMARILKTNSKYVSWIIAKHRGKGTIEYIIDLKLDHILELLDSGQKYRNYTNKALAQEAGFGTTQLFVKVFKARTGHSPSDFIKRLV